MMGVRTKKIRLAAGFERSLQFTIYFNFTMWFHMALNIFWAIMALKYYAEQ